MANEEGTPLSPRISVASLEDLLAHEKEILERINSVPNGGNLFLLQPFLLLDEVGVKVSQRARRQIVQRLPGLSALSIVPYEELKKSKEKQKIRFRIRSLLQRRAL